MAKVVAKVFCTRCERTFTPADQGATLKTACPFCGFGSVVTFEIGGFAGTQRTAGNDANANAATGVTVT